MITVADHEALAWTTEVAEDGGPFDWDEGNQRKNEKHGITPDEIESIFEHAFVFVGRITEPKHDEPRWLVLGMDHDQRLYALIYCRRGDALRPISCRPMRRKEREYYEEVIDGT